MVYIDQPVQVGYSYDEATNVTVDRSAGPGELHPIASADFAEDIPEPNSTFYIGTAGSQRAWSTTNSTNQSAVALWHFAQTWFEEFPHYKPADEKISIWAESYGGHYGPAFARFFARQNERIQDGGNSTPGAHYLRLDTLGLVNALVDWVVQAPGYLEMAHNNTYGIQAINDTTYQLALDDWARPNGIQDMLLHCRDLARRLDPFDRGDNVEVNEACSAADEALESRMIDLYRNASGPTGAGFGWYDVAHPRADPFPPPYHQGYLNQGPVQASLGVPVNHTAASPVVSEVFGRTGDSPRDGYLDDIAYLLDRHDMKVALMYGDRDFACNWIGGERMSLAIPHRDAESFAASGYEPVQVNATYVGGQVRQYGRLSFSRVYQAGHMVPSYQPETSYKIFMRTMRGRDVATGHRDIHDGYATQGPSSTWHIRNQIPPQPQPECYILMPDGCTEEQWEAVRNGSAVIKDFILQSFGDKHDENVLGADDVRGSSRQVVLGLGLNEDV